MAQRPVAASPQGRSVADVESWRLTGPLPDAIEVVPHTASSPWEGLLASAAQRRAGLLFASESAHCVAREVGLFFVANRANPSQSLNRFIGSRCGVSDFELSTGFRYGDVADTVPEERLFAEWSDAVSEDLAKAVEGGGGPQLAGIWSGRKSGRAVVCWVVAQRLAQVERIPLVPGADGRVVIQGQMLTPADRVQGLVNVGRFSVRRCVADPMVKLPRFALTCDVDRSDQSAWIEVGAYPPGRVVGHVVISVQISPQGVPGDTFTRVALTRSAATAAAGDAAAPVAAGAAAIGAPTSPAAIDPACANTGSGDLLGALAACVNGVRTQAGIGALRVVVGESQTAARLAPHFFASVLGAEPELVADKVVLGLRAGWDVGEPLRYGDVVSGLVQGAGDVERLIASVLERPSGRSALLDSEVARLAVGTVAIGSGESGVVGAIFATYALFDGRDKPGDADKVFERLGALRARQKRPVPTRFTAGDASVVAAAHRIATEGRDPTDALNDALTGANAVVQNQVRGWWVDTDKLEDLELPADLIEAATLNVSIAVSHYRRAGEPWMRYVVLLVISEPSQTLVRRRQQSRRDAIRLSMAGAAHEPGRELRVEAEVAFASVGGGAAQA
ncbi:MAG TPA: hypothetical protein VMT47_18070 [Polyangia bacterium]|nr:hypothetical protein [Polyangia bacterium]